MLTRDMAGWLMGEWISVKDGLPESSCEIIVMKKVGGVTCGFWHSSTRHYKNPMVSTMSCSREFTHWMPLPEPLKK